MIGRVGAGDKKGRVIAMIPARMNSSRLPAKHFQKIGNKTLLQWVVHQVKGATLIDKIVLCVPGEEESKPFVSFAKEEGIECFWYPGEVNDVVGRLTSAAKLYQADVCILCSGDSPLLYGPSINKLILLLQENRHSGMADFALREGKDVIHEGLRVERRRVWEAADRLSENPEYREHQFPILQLHPEKFEDLNPLFVLDDPIFYSLDHRISVDTPTDLLFMRKLYERVSSRGVPFSLPDVLDLLADEPELLKINSGVEQRELFDKPKQAVIILEDYRNLSEALSFAKKAMNQHKMGVHFLTKSESLLEKVREEDYFGEVLSKETVSGFRSLLKNAFVVVDHDNGMRLVKESGNEVQSVNKLKDVQLD